MQVKAVKRKLTYAQLKYTFTLNEKPTKLYIHFSLSEEQKTMNAICMIPARFNSSRFPGKLLAKALGKTILQRTFENARRCAACSKVYVATDHELIAKHIEELGGEVIWTSPSCPNGTQRLIEALQKTPELQQADIILNVQGDHPCTSTDGMEAVIRLLQEDKEAVMSTAATALNDLRHFHSPHVVKCVFDQHQNALYFSRAPIPYKRDGVPKHAYHHLGLYAYRTSFLLSSLGGASTPLQVQEDLEQLSVLEKGFRIKIALVDDPPFGVDTPEDLISLKAHLRNSCNKNPTYPFLKTDLKTTTNSI